MGRKPKSTKQKILEKVQKCRINRKEPKIKSLKSEPPEYLNEAGRKEWKRVWPEVKSYITIVDKTALGAYCAAYSRWLVADKELNKIENLVEMTPKGMLQQSPFVAMARNWMQMLIKISSELGFTPASRSKVIAPGSADEDENFLFKKK